MSIKKIAVSVLRYSFLVLFVLTLLAALYVAKKSGQERLGVISKEDAGV